MKYILSKNLQEMLELAEGVGENGDIAAHTDASSLEEFKKQQEKEYKLYKQQKMPMIGAGLSNA